MLDNVMRIQLASMCEFVPRTSNLVLTPGLVRYH
jgi:hypothetical protein